MAAGAWAFTPPMTVTPTPSNQTGNASLTGCGPAPPTPRWSSTVKIVSAGASLAHLPKLPRIKNRREYEKELVDLPDWRIACNFVGKGHRRQGVATAALAGALELIAELGGGRVEGYPEPADAVPAGFLFHGALSTFEKAGFTKDRMIGRHRWVVVKDIKPTSGH